MSINKKKLFLQIFCGVFGAWLLFLALVPTLLSQGGLKYFANKKIEGSFSYKSAKLSWFKAQVIQGIEYKNPDMGLDLKVDHFKTEATLWNLLLHPKDLKETQIDGLAGSLNFSPEKEASLLANFESAPGSDTKLEHSDALPYLIVSLPFVGKFHVDHSAFVFKSPDYDSIAFNQIQLNCNMLSKEGPMMCTLACETAQNELSGSAFVNFELGGFDKESKLILTPFDRDILFLSPKGYMQLNAQLTNLPSEGLDHLAMLYNPRLEGLLSSLFGDSLNFGSQINIVKGKSTLNLMADAPNMDLKFSGSIVQNELFLDEASICNFKITPNFIQAFSKAAHFKAPLNIVSESHASIHLDRLSVPLDFKNFNLNTLSCNAQFSLGEMNFTKSSSLENFTIKQIKGAVDTFDIGENVTFHLKALAENHGNPMMVKADGQISKLLNLQETFGIDQLQGNCQVELKDVPSQFLSYFSLNKDLFNEILGPSTSLSLNFKGSPKEGALALSLSSSRLQLQEALFNLKDNNKLTLAKTSRLGYRLNPSFAKLILNPRLTLLHPFEVQGVLRELELSLASNDRLISDIDLKLSSKPFETSYENSKAIHIQDTKVYVSKNDAKEIEAKAYFTAVLPEDYESTALGNSFNFSLLFKDVPMLTQGTKPELAALIKTKTFSTEFVGALGPDFTLNLTENLKATLQNANLNADQFSLTSKSPIEVEILPCTLSLLDLKHQVLNLKGTLKTEALVCSNQDQEFTLNELSLPFEYSGAEESLNFTCTSNAGKLSLLGTLKHLDPKNLENLKFDLTGKLTDCSTDLLVLLKESPIGYQELIGKSFNLDFNAKGKPSSEHETKVTFNFSSQYLNSEGQFSFGKELFLNQPIVLNYTCTPEHSNALFTNLTSLELLKETNVKVILNRLQKNMSEFNQLPDAFEGEVHAEEISTNKGDIHHLEGHFETPNLSEILKVQLHAHTYLDSKPGEISLKADLIEPLNKQEKDSLIEKTSGLFSCELRYFPTKLFHTLIQPLAPEIASLTSTLGPVFNLSSSMKLIEGVGPLQLDLESEQIKTSCNLQFKKDHLLLNEDLKAELRLTPSLCKEWLNRINPLLTSAVSSQAPLILSFKKEGFYFPLAPFELGQLAIPTGVLELGQISLREESHLGQLYALFSKTPPDALLKTWFTPCKFSIEKGVLHLKSNHLQLAEKFHLAFWGKRDFNRDENAFYIGLPLQTLQSVFGLSKLPREYVFQIPLQEEQGSLVADWKTARQQLSILTSASSPFVTNKTGAETSSIDLNQIMEIVAQSQAPKILSEDQSFPWGVDEVKETESFAVEEIVEVKEPSQNSQILYNFLVEMKKKMKL